MQNESSGSQVIRFRTFELDVRAGELRRRGARIRLQEQPLRILEMLLAHPGQLVTREELRSKLWPSNSFVDFDHGLNKAINKLREALDDSAESPRFIETIPRRGYRMISTSGKASGRVESLAVLPLEDLSHDPAQEYFADGLTEALITSLAHISALRVTSRTTAMTYKGAHKSVPEIARELGVDGVVEGTVLRSDGRVRISVQLIEASTDTHMWAESYEEDLREVLRLQARIAAAVAREIQVKLTPQEQTSLARARPVNPDAYIDYLMGRFHWNKRTPEGVKKGAEHFEQAIEKDPAYAAAYAGLADCAGISGFWGYARPEEGCGKAKIAARKSLEVEETAEAHASLGWAILHYDLDHAAAEQEFQRAIEVNCRYAHAHQWYGQCLAYMGRFEEALLETTQALQLEPLSLIIHTSHAAVYWSARMWDRAIEYCHKILELDPDFLPTCCLLAHVYQGKGMYDEAVRERQRAVKLACGAPFFVAELGGSCAAAGRANEAHHVLQQLRELANQQYVSAHSFALIYAGLKEIDEAFEWLEKAFRERSALLAWLKTDPRVDNLRSDLRFQDLLSRMSFPESR